MDRLSISHGAGHFDHVGKGPRGHGGADERIRQEVCQALTRNREVDATDIDVEVSQGVVILNGTIPGRFMKKEAERCIEELRGVVDVFNLLVLQPHLSETVKELINNQNGS